MFEDISDHNPRWIEDQWPVGVVWEIRIVATNMAGSAASTATTAVSNVWTDTYQHLEGNENNGADANARIAIRNGVQCANGYFQEVCFNIGLGGRPFTMGDYLYYPGSRDDLNRLVACEARQRLALLSYASNGWILAHYYGQDLLRHESVHSLQEAGFPTFDRFMATYGLASLASMKTTGTPDLGNIFEKDANLYWGHYQGPCNGGSFCSYR